MLATTSIGQEGLDFHAYCRKVVHWNLPSNPIDLEQREGRVNRYKCLAVRQNIAQQYGGEFDWERMFERMMMGLRMVRGVDAARDKEGAAILAALPPRAHVILLAIEGKERSSEELSARLDDLMLRGNSDIAFVIGGSDGVSDEVRARADEMLSFGRITLPHNLARVVLLEQIYRACKISRGEPYHK